MLKVFDNINGVFIKRVVLLLVGSCSWFYTIYDSNFAEKHISLSFLDFPIFAGEILLFLCVGLLAISYSKSLVRINSVVNLIAILYILWVISYAFWGYYSSGPVALRNAALFYYAVFALIGYLIFERSIYNSHWNWVILVFLFGTIYFAVISDYFVPMYVLLTLGFCFHMRHFWLKLAWILAVSYYIFISKFILIGSRSHMIGICVMAIFLAYYFLICYSNLHKF